jgi:hypothetical protein
MKKPPITKAQFDECLNRLGFAPEDMQAPLESDDPHGALLGLKERIKTAWRKLVPEIHPDRGGDEETFKLFQGFLDTLEMLEVVRRPPPAPPPPQRPTRPVVFHQTASTFSTSSATTMGGGFVTRITIIRR